MMHILIKPAQSVLVRPWDSSDTGYPYNAPRPNIADTLTLFAIDICNLQNIGMGSVRMMISRSRLIIPANKYASAGSLQVPSIDLSHMNETGRQKTKVSTETMIK
jgi:hypothetical protein